MAEELVNLTINGQPVQAPKNATIWQAAQRAGLFIPIYCYHPKMPPLGACRICLVEVEKAPKPMAACTTGITEGMVVHIDSSNATKARAGVMEFLLINHPLDCPICDKGGECDLQNYAVEYGRSTGRNFEEKRHLGKAIELGPTIALDRERCIMCQRCVRFCNEIVQDEGLIIDERGAESQIATYNNQPYVSQFSGNVTEICPVGALTARTYRFKARPWELRHTPSVCSHCSVGCNLEVDTRLGREVARFSSRTNDSVDDGWLCDRGRYGYGFIQSEQRLKSPLIRRGGSLMPVSWDEAFSYVVTKLQNIRQKHGGGAIGGISGSHNTNEELYLFQKLMRGLLGTGNVDHRHGSFGSIPAAAIPQIHTASIAGLESCKLIVLVGANPGERQPVIELRIKKALKMGAKLAVVGAVPAALKRFVTLHVPVRTGQIEAAVNALTAQLLKTGEAAGVQDAGVKSWLSEAYANADYGQNLQPQIEKLAGIIATTERAAYLYDEYAADAENPELVASLARLALAGGHLGKTGQGLMRLTENNNSWGALDMGLLPGVGAGYTQATEGLSYAEMLGANGGTTPLKALVVMGANPLAHTRREALAGLELLVAVELFMTPTAEIADVVLPGASFAEKEGTFTNTEGRVQHINPAIQPLLGVAPDAAILLELATRLGADVKTKNPQGLFDEIARTSPIHKDMSYAALGGEGALRPLNRDAANEAVIIPDWLRNARVPKPLVLLGESQAETEAAVEAAVKAVG